MIRWVKALARIGLVIAAIAATVPMITFAQTNEPAIESVPAEAEEVNASPTEDEDSPDNDSRFYVLRSEVLDDRAAYIDRWLAVIAIVLTFFGIVVAVGGVLGFRRFREIETEAGKSVDTARQHETAAKDIRERIEQLLSESEANVQSIRRLAVEFAAGNPNKANQAIQSVLENPNASLIDQAIARALDLQQQDKKDEAIEKWRAIAHIAQGSDNYLAAGAWLSIGHLILGKNPEGSVLANNEAIRLKPDYADAYNNRGNAKQKLGQYDAAVADYDEAIRLNPDMAEAYNNRGTVKQKLGQYDAAIADCNEAIRLNPNLADAYSNRGAVKQKLGQYDAAVADCNEAIRRNPEAAAEAYVNRGAVKKKLGQYDAAIADCNEAIRLNPNLADAYNNRGAAKYELGQYDAAVADYDETIRLNPEAAEAYANRGEVKNKLGEYKNAVADCNEAIRLNPNMAEAYLNRGNAKAKLKLKDEARKDFKLVLELARKANNAKIVAQAEQALRDLNDAEGS